MSNREYKSDVFSMLMEESENALQVFNGLNNSHYTDPSKVEYRTLENGISLTVRNDASFIVGTDINFYEHQSILWYFIMERTRGPRSKYKSFRTISKAKKKTLRVSLHAGETRCQKLP